MSNHAAVHGKYLRKFVASSIISDHGEHEQTYPESRAVLCDKGYVGALEFLRATHPRLKPPIEKSSPTEEAHSKLEVCGSVTVKVFFRVSALYSVSPFT